MDSPRASRLTHPLCWLLLAGLFAGVFWLRWPSFDFRLWNVDEAIHATVARSLLDGGTLYRDAIDQRTPLTYYAVAAIFAVCGENNTWALHAFAALLVAGTAAGLLLLGRRLGRTAAGLWAAGLFAVLSTTLLYPGDAYALGTEWFVAAFTTGAACLFWTGPESRSRRRLALVGLSLGLAFLAKQPALLDLGPPLFTTLWLAFAQRIRPLRALGDIAALLAGFAAPVLLAIGAFTAAGALGDAIFYTWTYNLRYYGPEIGPQARLLSAGKPFLLLWETSPVVALALVAGLGWFAFRLLQSRPTAAERAENPRLLFLLVWFVASLGAAASGGRGYDHYYVQLLPALCLIAGWTLVATTTWMRTVRFTRPLALAGLSAVALHLGYGAWTARARAPLPVDPSVRVSAFVREHSRPDERIFVWGYHPDIYVFSDRRAASRFVYGSFLTGLVPWSNVDPARDTTYAIVPGAMETLLRELDAARPVFIIDCSPSMYNRHWGKYPLSKFPRLQEFIRQHYVIADPAQFVGQGFRVFLLKDASRLQPAPTLASTPAAGVERTAPSLAVPPALGNQSATLTLAGQDARRELLQLEVLADGRVVCGASFHATGAMTLRWEIPAGQFVVGTHRLQARATFAGGQQAVGEEVVWTQTESAIAPERLPSFAATRLAAPVAPQAIEAAFGADVAEEDGHQLFYLHAPARMVYPLDGNALVLTGRFGLRDGAYAPANPAPSDGAEFIVTRIQASGVRSELFRRLLRPAMQAADRGPQSFSVTVRPDPGDLIELTIENGPDHNASSDWTYWSDLQFRPALAP